MPVMCRHCSKLYSTQRNLNRHLKESHGLKSEVIAYNIKVKSYKCLEGCNISFALQAELVSHLKTIHNIGIEHLECEFASMNEFTIWLKELQSQNSVEYIKPRGTALNSEQNSVIYYICSRSGKPRNISSKDKRMKKVQGSKKINFSCISQIKLTIDKSISTVTVLFCKTHYGHYFEIKHLTLPREERANIAQRLVLGVSTTKILDTYREAIDERKLKRINIITRKDINNIKSSYNIQIQEGVRHSVDAISVDMYVKECCQSENNPILFYKPQNVEDNEHFLKKEDFCLIIMNTSQKKMLMQFGHNIIATDSTHGLNSYDFELTTVMVVDDFGEGFPGACMLTNRKDSLIFYLFFQKIKQHTGVINNKIFMSDITNVFYNPWKEVMGFAPQQIYCAWHIDRAWQSNINKISNIDKRQNVYKALKLLQTLTDKLEFHKVMSNFQSELHNDQETFNFGVYFENNYAHNYEKWAYCYRQNAGINTNMRLEAMHKILKYIYLEGKKIKRLDKGLYALNKYIRDKIVDQIVKTVKGKNSKHVINIHVRRKSAVTASFQVIQQDFNVWKVNPKITDGVNLCGYTVSKTSLVEPCCNLVCAICNICVHSFVCHCTDFFIHNTICKHIHGLVLEIKRTTDSINNIDEKGGNLLNNEDVSGHLKTLSQDINNAKNRDYLLQKISLQQCKLDANLKLVQNTEILKHIERTLKTENILIESDSKSIKTFSVNNELNKEPPNKKIEKQLNFHSTKKRKIDTKTIKKPNLKEVEELKDYFLNPNLEYISKSSQEDHNYF